MIKKLKACWYILTHPYNPEFTEQERSQIVGILTEYNTATDLLHRWDINGERWAFENVKLSDMVLSLIKEIEERPNTY